MGTVLIVVGMVILALWVASIVLKDKWRGIALPDCWLFAGLFMAVRNFLLADVASQLAL